jgi:hypothetical protein
MCVESKLFCTLKFTRIRSVSSTVVLTIYAKFNFRYVSTVSVVWYILMSEFQSFVENIEIKFIHIVV